MKTKLHKVFAEKISGEWGNDDPLGDGVFVIRTANFYNDGSIDFSNLVTRLIQKDARDENGKLIKYTDGTIKKENDIKKIEDKKVIDEDILIEKSGGGVGTPVGRVVFFKNPNNKIYLSNNFSQILRVNPNLAVPKYIFYYLRYLYIRGNVLKYQNQTTGIFNLKLERYLQEEIALPEYSQQFGVVAKLDEIFNLISKINDSISKYEALKKSLFIKKFVNNPLKENWKFEEISKYIKKTKYGVADALNSEEGCPVIRMNNITYQGSLDLSVLKYIKVQNDELEKYELKDRDVLFNRTNSIELVGKCAVWENLNNFMYAGYLFTIKLNELKLNPFYLVAYLNSDLGKKMLKAKAKQSGNMANFSASLLGKQKILVPSIKLQNKFESEIKLLNSQISLLSESKKILDCLFKSVLQNAFNPNTEIEEQSIFKDLIKKLKISDLKGNKKRLQYLIELFEENKFDNDDNYINAKDKLFDLIIAGEINQNVKDDKIILEVK
jgi:type I restriction enzyme S subunit